MHLAVVFLDPRWTCLFFYGIIIAIYQNTLSYCIVIYPYVSLVYIVLFRVQIQNFTEHNHTTKAILNVLRFLLKNQDVPLLRPKFMLPKREKRPLIDPKEPMLPM